MEDEPKNDFELLQEAIALSPQEIEREFANTDNIWLACVNTRLTIIMNYLGLSQMESLIDKETEVVAQEKAQVLAQEVLKLQNVYGEKSSVIPEEIKQDILSRLNVLV